MYAFVALATHVAATALALLPCVQDVGYGAPRFDPRATGGSRERVPRGAEEGTPEQ